MTCEVIEARSSLDPTQELGGNAVRAHLGCQLVILGKFFGLFYSFSPLWLFEVASRMLKTGSPARNKGSFFVDPGN